MHFNQFKSQYEEKNDTHCLIQLLINDEAVLVKTMYYNNCLI